MAGKPPILVIPTSENGECTLCSTVASAWRVRSTFLEEVNEVATLLVEKVERPL